MSDLIKKKSLVSSVALQGAVGECLEAALQEVFGTEGTEDSVAVHHVLESFGNAVAVSDWKTAPRALLQGRLDHYNRIGGQWRILTEDVELKTRPSKVQKRYKGSLWDQEATEESVSLPGSLEILAYNDK